MKIVASQSRLLIPMEEVVSAIASHINRNHPVALCDLNILAVRFGVRLRHSDRLFINITDLQAEVSIETLASEPPQTVPSEDCYVNTV